ncbi:hypothetical protein [Aureivirga sp. CE67]|uniref:hypothetical protein n=1 Tax=Aureivirga sp. CE67 TaxID=1788983 RepID=UPI0018CBBBF8|nr:hypothetical protein [Aureivirga sp. CE67]
MKIYLEEEIETIGTVTINAVKVKRDHTLRIFKEEFLGKHHDSPYLKILNEHKIKFNITSDSTLIARCDEPIIIENKRLGYKMKYDLITFEAKLYLRTYPYKAESVHFAGFCFFNDLKNLKKKHFKRRREAYLGSSKHFIKSLYNNTLELNKYHIMLNESGKIESLYTLVEQSKNEKTYKMLIPRVYLHYNREFCSSFELNEDGQDTFTIDKFGNISPAGRILFTGELGAKRMGEALPDDYQFQ